MRRIDELHLHDPFAEARLLRDLLRQESHTIGRRQVANPDAADGDGGAISETAPQSAASGPPYLSVSPPRPHDPSSQSGVGGGYQCAMQARLEKDQLRRLVADRQLECCPALEGTGAEGGCKAPPRANGGVSYAAQPEQYRAWATPHEPGYHRVYGETTKRAPEASVLSAANPQ